LFLISIVQIVLFIIIFIGGMEMLEIDLKRVKDLREDHDLKQKELAEILGISQRAYSHYESGTRKIPLDVLVELADYYHCSTDYLLGRTNKKGIC
jgi:Predicted transcriptional regulators